MYVSTDVFEMNHLKEQLQITLVMEIRYLLTT